MSPVDRSHEAAVGEAVASLTTRLEEWGVADAHTHAAAYVHDMLRAGWRPVAPHIERVDLARRPLDPDVVKDRAARARALLTPTTEETE